MIAHFEQATHGETTRGDRPLVVHTRSDLRAARAAMTGSVAVVMTMGALHAGHVSLVAKARGLADHVIVTVFVNPLQFGAGEDFDSYPRTLAADVEALSGKGVEVVFAPSADEMYPGGPPQVSVSAGPLGTILEGAVRPGHFDGVLTVVAKLLNLTSPTHAIFGQKDAQQLVAIRTMVRDLAMPVSIEAADIVRDPDGLALSSRNAYLTPAQRDLGLRLPRSLEAARQAAAAGAAPSRIARAARDVLAQGDRITVNYAVAREPETLGEVPDDYVGPLRVLVAARVGETRLLDNELVQVNGAARR
ncbi:pantoate--beta-alanine ligase [Rarobacter incanus]|uniref:Pantothenate synthetase n=1 Tax=Rarobacter incanus TaxID=153494 RepID=A0A542SQ12_9MICO|nr:pantoate--beta-alanine ligase [Rarobacter incanus]TQK76357.1 pantothenate synthetase [Rarobacter incanus]